LDFIYNNSYFSNIVAGRKPGHYNEAISCKVSKAVKGAEKERYKRVNLAGAKTVEFRMFSGCIGEFELSYKIEFVHALIAWSRNTTVKNGGVREFVMYVKENQKLYRNLFNYFRVIGRIK
jgi:hypothetical protein